VLVSFSPIKATTDMLGVNHYEEQKFMKKYVQQKLRQAGSAQVPYFGEILMSIIT